ncbi:VOC family protein [Angustibacter aerolatus]|uniref:Lyase n=1 Tax=Angustibacter aerolatus TaxID=1162965 RepID=A0ABQ6JDS8_9ACTN|nr:VOC family protein [Angustibacter aerolatus]GMA85942.1 lyase [Angustibacter aerolatus]
MTISIAHCFITIDDEYDAALGFYRDALGLEVRTDFTQGEFRWLTLVAPGQEGLEVVLVNARAGRSPEDGEAVAALVAKGSMPGVNLRTDDLETLFEKVRAGGYEVMQEPMDQPWGPRDCAFRDPAGTMVRISAAG